MEYRLRSTGQIVSVTELKRMHPNTSLPKVWSANTFDLLGIDPVLESPKPTPDGTYRMVLKDTPQQDAKGNWVWSWRQADMFSNFTDEEGATHTKEQQEQDYQARLDGQVAESVRQRRNQLLTETDWMVLKASETEWNIPAEVATYRQSLRDITAHANFPNLAPEDWPVNPTIDAV